MRIPKLSLHVSGQYQIRIKGKSHYLGRDKAQAERLYRNFLRDHFMAAETGEILTGGVLVKELLESFKAHVLSSNSPRWRKQKEAKLTQAFAPVLELYGDLPVDAFGSRALITVRMHLAKVTGRSRGYINELVSAIKQAFKWGVPQELVQLETYQRLFLVPNLQPGEMGLEDREPREAVDERLVSRTLEYLSEFVGDIVRLLQLTAARPDEICRLTPEGIVKEKKTWHMYFRHHKTKRKNKKRCVVFGKEAQAILLRRWPSDPEGYFFPADSFQTDKGHYQEHSLNQAIKRACWRGDLPEWSPYQLRHAAVTRISLEHGEEVAAAVAGNSVYVTRKHYDHSALQKAKKAVG